MKKILSMILLALVLLSIMISKSFCQIVVNHKDVVSKYQCFTATVYVYQDLDSMATEDFYAFWMRIHGNDTVYDFVWVTIETTEGICDVWQPTEGVSLGGSVTVSIGHISIGVNLIPLSYTAVDDEYTNTISWFFDAQDVDDAEFAAGFWVPEGSPLHFTITVRAEYFVPPLSFPVWDDTATWSSTTRPQLSVSTSSCGTTDPAPGTHTYNYGSSVTVTASPYSGYTFDYWLLDGANVYKNPIVVTMDADHTLTAYFSHSGGGGGLCPTLFVWNDPNYAEEGVLNIHAESDVTVQHTIQNTPVLKDGFYNLQLRELDNYTSHIDQIKLYAIDSQGKWHVCPLTYAYHNELGKAMWRLFFNDEKRVNLTPTQTIDLKFLPSIPYSLTAYFIFEINGYNPKGFE